jgi:hypothetical protein
MGMRDNHKGECLAPALEKDDGRPQGVPPLFRTAPVPTMTSRGGQRGHRRDGSGVGWRGGPLRASVVLSGVGMILFIAMASSRERPSSLSCGYAFWLTGTLLSLVPRVR